jgi:cytochrome c peroxidase
MRSDRLPKILVLTSLAAVLALGWVTTSAPAQATEQPGCERDAACLRQAYATPSSLWPRPTVDDGVRWQELSPRPPLPAQPPELAALGERLFHDLRLSRDQDVSCASCHAPHLGFADGRRLAVGHDGRVGARHTPGLWGVAFAPTLMWDGRADRLETQALLPMLHPSEMAADLPLLLERLNRHTDYPKHFAQVFNGQSTVTPSRLTAALASYQRTLQAPRSRFDDFIEGSREALTDQELRGLHLFRTRARCMNCHSGPQFTQHEFHQIGMSQLRRRGEDLGRQAVTGKPEDAGAMRTPGLRGIARTAPYMHTGIVPSLRGVLELYNAGMPQPRQSNNPLPPPSPLIQPLRLTPDEVQALEAFLRTL